MGPKEKRIVDCAIRWWTLHRPINWTEDKHIRNPLAGMSAWESELANAVASLLNDIGGTKGVADELYEESKRWAK